MKYLLVAWVLPLVLVLIPRLVMPNRGESRDAYPQVSLLPARVWVVGKGEARGGDFYELRILGQKGKLFFHRDPEAKPIKELASRIPRESELELVYWESSEGNVLLDIAAIDQGKVELLSFDDVMLEYKSRSRLIYLVAGIWFLVMNAFFVGLMRTRESDVSSQPE